MAKAPPIILDRHRSGLWTLAFHGWERDIRAEGSANRAQSTSHNSWRVGERNWDPSKLGEADQTQARKKGADEAAHLWSVAELVSILERNPHDADLLAAAQ